MPNYFIFIVGFSAFEAASFESFFRLASRRAVSYQITKNLETANLVLINSDHPVLMREMIAKPPSQKILLIGTTDQGTGWRLHQKPYTLMSLLPMLDSMLAPELAAKATPTQAASTQPAANTTQQLSSNNVAAMPARDMREAAYSPRPPVAQNTRQAPNTSASPDTRPYQDSRLHAAAVKAMTQDNILVVDDSDIALKFMQNRLGQFGYRAELARSGEEALAMIAMRQYKFVFLDVMMDGLDGYQTCRAIKQRKYSNGTPPMVIMLTSRGGTIDKIRGTLAGCEAYLTKPLNESDLVRVLGKRDSNASPNIDPGTQTGYTTQGGNAQTQGQ